MKIINNIDMLRKIKTLALPILALLSLSALGCAHTVKINTTPPGALVVVDGKKVGHSPTRFKEDPWPGEHVIRVSAPGYATRVVHVERKNTNWWWVAAGFGGCALCSGPACLTGASLANLSLCPACAGCMISSGASLGTILTIISAPNLCTIPAMSIGGLIGSTPLGLLALADESPNKIMIKMKPQPGYDASQQTDQPEQDTQPEQTERPASPTQEHLPSTEQNSDAPPMPQAPADDDPGPVLSY